MKLDLDFILDLERTIQEVNLRSGKGSEVRPYLFYLHDALKEIHMRLLSQYGDNPYNALLLQSMINCLEQSRRESIKGIQLLYLRYALGYAKSVIGEYDAKSISAIR